MKTNYFLLLKFGSVILGRHEISLWKRPDNCQKNHVWKFNYTYFTTDFDLCQSSDSLGDYGKDQTEIIRQKLHVWKRPDTYNMVLIASTEAGLTY